MPLISESSYRPPFFLKNGHLQTIYANSLRNVPEIHYGRHRIETPDGDFLDLDMAGVESEKLVILAHGLEGSSKRPYMLGMVRALNRRGWDALAWNFRGCSGEPSRKLRFYHSGDTPDLKAVLQYVLSLHRYKRIALIGFSLGGNIVLKFLGEQGGEISKRLTAAVAFSVPCDLHSGAEKMNRPSNRLYMMRFLRMLHRKILSKMEQYPGRIHDQDFNRMRTFREFDERYTAPLHGFAGAEDYWQIASSKPYLVNIRIPTLLVNALDDPFLAPACYPFDEALEHKYLFLETPAHGGHVGFVSFEKSGEYWSEVRAGEFLARHT